MENIFNIPNKGEEGWQGFWGKLRSDYLKSLEDEDLPAEIIDSALALCETGVKSAMIKSGFLDGSDNFIEGKLDNLVSAAFHTILMLCIKDAYNKDIIAILEGNKRP